MTNINIPREKIPWFPTIDPDLCIGDQDCVNFCRNNVLAFDEDTFKVVVVNPYNCVVGCDACAKICPQGAITFPDKDELRATLRRLRAEAQEQKAAQAAEKESDNVAGSVPAAAGRQAANS
jgi:NAD-dependent dihydropyrimidine dehydrogenase PreA subunit